MKIAVTSRHQTEFIEITSDIQRLVEKQGIQNGICMLFVPHTTAAITINENADPTVKSDILGVLNTIIPWKADYRHMEGNSPAHIKASLMGASELIAVEGGRLVLGTWQGIFFCEFDGPRTRSVHVHFMES
ncbi:MAG: secondary thiamine-phosphate synthase enzyme YjbQ [Desulfobacterales bacterium]|nr:secondary thiamine-phosphate synthase enzyme YjbQ [Desulfobacterales bacterium]